MSADAAARAPAAGRSLAGALSRRPSLLAAGALVAIAGALVAIQPLGSPWWTGGDADSTYVASALRLFAGKPTKYFDHPGIPLQEVAAAVFTVSWALDSHGKTRAEAARGWLWNLDSTRPYLRTLASLLFVGSALLAFLTIRAVLGSARWGFLGGLLFLGLPDLIGAEPIFRPDGLVAALCVVATGLLTLAYRRGSAALFAAAAAVAGYALTVKLPATGLLVGLALGTVLIRPPEGWALALVTRTRDTLGRRWVLVAAVAGSWLAAVVLLNLGAAAPNGRYVRDLCAGLVALAAAGWLAWRVLRRTRARTPAALALLGAGAYLAGMLVPNLLFASTPPAMVRWVGNNLAGRDVTSSSTAPSVGDLHVLRPWLPLATLACVGLLRSLRARDWSALFWLAGAGTTGALALTQATTLRYFDPAVALLIPPALRAFAGLRPQPVLWAAAAVGLVLVVPFRDGIEAANDRGANGTRVEALNRWVEARLRPGQVALTVDQSNDSRYFYLVRHFAVGPPPPYRILTADGLGAGYVREHRLLVRYLIVAPDNAGQPLLRALGLPGTARQVAGQPRIYEVDVAANRRPKTTGAASARTANAKK